jgi:hypothetical protein
VQGVRRRRGVGPPDEMRRRDARAEGCCCEVWGFPSRRGGTRTGCGNSVVRVAEGITTNLDRLAGEARTGEILMLGVPVPGAGRP